MNNHKQMPLYAAGQNIQKICVKKHTMLDRQQAIK